MVTLPGGSRWFAVRPVEATRGLQLSDSAHPGPMEGPRQATRTARVEGLDICRVRLFSGVVWRAGFLFARGMQKPYPGPAASGSDGGLARKQAEEQDRPR